MSANERAQGSIANVIEDIQQFADPYAPVLHEKSGNGYMLRWKSHGRERSALITIKPAEKIEVEYRGQKYSYSRFLSHEDLANLRFLADSSISQLRHQGLHTGGKVETTAVRPSRDTRGAAHVLIDQSVREHQNAEYENDSTRVVFLAAHAGAGKTKALERLVLFGSDAFLQGKSSFLYFYVNAQGQALARVDQAFAVELDRLGANLRYSAISVLTRVGALVPVIDGFDELIGAVSYDEAFQSLGRFLEELNGQGQIVAAARSTYYEREFQGRVRKRPHNIGWELDTIQLDPWEQPQRHLAVAEQAELLRTDNSEVQLLDSDIETSQKRLEEIAHQYPEFMSRPFFAVQTARLLLRGEKLNRPGGDLLRQLTSSLVQREVSQKFLDKNHMPMTDFESLWSFFCEVATEMWYQQTRAMDAVSLDAVVAIATEGWQPLAIDRLRERKRDMPVFTSVSGSPDGSPLEFAHDYFFSIFLADAFIRTAFIGTGFAVQNALSKGALPEELPASLIGVADAPLRDNLLSILNDACRADSLRSAIIKENAGTIAAALISVEYSGEKKNPKPILLKGMVFGNVALRGNIDWMDCNDCLFRRTDIRSLRIQAGHWSRCQLELPEVSQETRLRVDGLVVGAAVRGIRIYGNNERQDIWDPEEVKQALMKIGVKLPQHVPRRKISPDVVKIVDKITRIYYTRVKFSDRDDPSVTFMSNPKWPLVLRALLHNKIVYREASGASGPPKTFYRCLVDPSELMAGLDPSSVVRGDIKAFWDGLESS